MSKLKDKFAGLIQPMRDEIRAFIKEHGDKQVSTVNVKQVYGGMRGVRAMVCDTSNVPPDKGLVIRGIPLNKLFETWPEDIFWLLCTGELPSDDERKDSTRISSIRRLLRHQGDVRARRHLAGRF